MNEWVRLTNEKEWYYVIEYEKYHITISTKHGQISVHKSFVSSWKLA